MKILVSKMSGMLRCDSHHSVLASVSQCLESQRNLPKRQRNYVREKNYYEGDSHYSVWANVWANVGLHWQKLAKVDESLYSLANAEHSQHVENLLTLPNAHKRF
jgi:hypothetical protein